MKCYLVCDVRENFPSAQEACSFYSDHPTQTNVDDIVKIIRKAGIECEFFGGVQELIDAIHSHASFEECFFFNYSDGLVQSYARVQAPMLCEILNVPYSGSGVFASALINNKFCTTSMMRNSGLKVADAFRITKTDVPTDEQITSILPVFIKPNTEGSSVGITSSSMQTNLQGTHRLIESMRCNYDELIIEEYIPGIDVTVLVIGNCKRFKLVEPLVLTPSEHDFLCIEEKSSKSIRRSLGEEILGEKINNALKCAACTAFQKLECRDIARFDFRIANSGIYFIEANMCPRLSRSSEAGYLAKSLGREFDWIIEELLDAILYRLSQSWCSVEYQGLKSTSL